MGADQRPGRRTLPGEAPIRFAELPPETCRISDHRDGLIPTLSTTLGIVPQNSPFRAWMTNCVSRRPCCYRGSRPAAAVTRLIF